MKKIIILLFLTIINTSNLFAKDYIKVNNLDLEFNGEQGELTADLINYSNELASIKLTYLNYDLFNDEEIIKIKNDNQNVSIKKNKFKLLDNISFFDMNSSYLTISNNNELDFSANEINFEMSQGIQQLQQTKITCFNTSGQSLDLIDVCLQRSTISISGIETDQEKSFFFQEILKNEVTSKLFDIKIKDLVLLLSNGGIYGQFDIDTIIDIPIKIWGEIFYEETRNNHIVKIKLEKVKIGFINSTKLVLKSLKKLKIKNLTVEGNYLIIQL